jgi:predicted dehydrogenase
VESRRSYAIVGTGHRARTYIQALTGPYRAVARIVAFCDPNAARADHYRSAYGLHDVPIVAPGDFSPLLRQRRPDVVLVTSPDHTHDTYICAALAMGIDVITEKPMTIDEERLLRIKTAAENSSARLAVTFNYRYSPRNSTVKQLLADGAIGTVTSVHFEWLLDTAHGADYFRRWHREKSNSGGLLVHKSTHHFDLVNWWLADTATSVYAMGGLKFYGERNARQRGIAPRPRLGRDLPRGDPFRINLAADPALRALYLDAEALDGYHRDVDVFADGITIEDSLSLVIGYQRGATMTYSLTAFSPWEGYRVAFNGTGGRIELDVVERSRAPSAAVDEEEAPVIDPSAGDAAHSGPDGSRPAGEWITLQRLWEPAVQIPIPAGGQAHGGGDDLLLRDLFRGAAGDNLGRAAGYQDGMRSVLLGIAANRSLAEDRPVQLAEFGFDLSGTARRRKSAGPVS